MAGILTGFLEKQRIKMVKPYLHGTILDIGCGYAPVLRTLPGEVDYTGLDRSPGAITWLKSQYPRRTFEVIDIDREELRLHRKFDVVVMMAVIEHLVDPGFTIRQVPDLLEDNGKLVITTPTPLGNFIHHFGARLRLFSTEAAEEHYLIFKYETIRTLFKPFGLEIVYYHKYLMGGNQMCIAMKKGFTS